MRSLLGYVVKDALHRGSRSVVHRAVRLDTGLAVVLKVPVRENDETALVRFRRELEVGTKVEGPNVVRVLGLELGGDRPALVLEDFGSRSLASLLAEGPLGLEAALRISSQVARGLARLHDLGFVHCAVDPGNVLVEPSTFEAKLADLSSAVEIADGPGPLLSHERLPLPLEYASPEQTGRTSRPLDRRTDFYSLGATLYQMIAGRPPFEEPDPLALVHAHLAREPAPLHALVASVPRVVSRLVTRLLAKNPEHRYQGAHGLAADLEECLASIDATGAIADFTLGLHDVPERLELARHLYGRDHEREVLLGAFREVEAGSKILLLVAGYSGIGKSALVADVERAIVEGSGLFVSGKFDQRQRNVPYAALGDALRQLCERLLTEPESRLEEFRTSLLAALGATAQLVIDVVPSLARIVGAQPPAPPTGLVEAEHRFLIAFQRFLGVFARAEHPLVLFLDDLQWADAATLRLLHALMTSEDPKHLLVLGAYRQEEVPPDHALTRGIDALRDAAVDVRTVTLGGLGVEDVADLLSDALHASRREVLGLARTIVDKTSGNPFFVEEFLHTLFRGRLLRFDLSRAEWTWDAAAIEGLGVARNVADLVVRRLELLPERTQAVLRVASTIGHRFSLSTLASVEKRTLEELRSDLEPAVRERILVPIESDPPGGAAPAGGEYRFVHDRVQQSTFEMTPAAERPALQLAIGRALLATAAPGKRDERLFEIVDLLDAGRALVDDPAERLAIARLNLEAGEAARATSAHRIARAYFNNGIALLPPNAWEETYELARDLHIRGFESSFASGESAEAEALSDSARPRLRTALERAELRVVRLALEATRGLYDRSIALGREALEELGETMPVAPGIPQLIAMQLKTKWRLRGRTVDELAALPPADPEARANLDILAHLFAPSYLANPKLFFWLIHESIQLSLARGNAPSSSVAYMTYGILLASQHQEFALAEDFGRLGLAIAESPSGLVFRAKLHMMFGLFIHPFRATARESLGYVRRSLELAQESGDIVYVCYASANTADYCLFVGDRLDDVMAQVEVGERLTRSYGQPDAKANLGLLKQYVRCLRGETLGPTSLSSSEGEEEALLDALQGAQTEFTFAVYLLWKISVHLLFGEVQAALALVLAHDALVESTNAGLPRLTEYTFVACLVLADAKRLGLGPRRRCDRMLHAKHARLETWSLCAPSNYRHAAVLVRAEIADAHDRTNEAEELYDEAIRDARANGFVQHEALAAERAGRAFLRRRSTRLARSYFAEAHDAYARWGATRKKESLEHEFRELAPVAEEKPRAPTDLDLTSVMRAVQAISSEIEVQRLLERTMTVVLQNAGAERGALLVETEGALEVVATLDPGRAVREGAVDGHLDESRSVPESLVRYVFRTGQDVILTHAAREDRFTRDPYVASRGTKSVLSIPVRHQDRVVGVLYLENDLVTGAFGAGRVEVLRLLVEQAAIALENSRLYDATQKLNVALRANEAKLSALLEGLPVGVFVAGRDGMPAYANRKAIEIAGLPYDPSISHEHLTEHYLLYRSGTDEIYPFEEGPLAKALHGETTMSDDMEFRVGDRRIPIAAWGSPVRGADGTVEFALVAFQDISAERAAAAERAALEEQLHQAQRLESIGRLAGGVAHDFNNLLTPMLVYSEMALRSNLADETLKSQLVAVKTAAERAAVLTRQLLAFGRREVLDARSVDLNVELAEFESMLRRIVREDVAIEFSLAPSIGKIRADRSQIQRIVMNVALNAVDAMPHGGKLVLATEDVLLEADAERELAPGAYVRLRVTDTGIGMDAETQRRIFEPFFTTKEPGKGTGLGLPTVYGLMKQHGGQVHVESALGRGSTFDLLFPRFDDEGSTGTEVEAPRAEPTPKASSATVLVVEDEAVVRSLLAEILRDEGYDVVATGDVLEALRLARELGPRLDLVVTDVVMPNMNGRELVRRLQTLRPELKALFVSGYADEALSARGALEPGVRLLQKPFTVEVLRREVSAALEG